MGVFDKISTMFKPATNMLKPATNKLSSIFNPTNANKINKSKKALAKAENTRKRLAGQSANLAALKPRLNNATQKYQQYDCAKYKRIIDEGKEKLGNASLINKLKALPTLGIKNAFGKVNRSEILNRQLRNANARVAAATTAKMNTAVKLAETRAQQAIRARELAAEANAKAAAAAKTLENVKAETPRASNPMAPQFKVNQLFPSGPQQAIRARELAADVNAKAAAVAKTLENLKAETPRASNPMAPQFKVNELFPSDPQQVPQNGRRLGPLVRARVNALEQKMQRQRSSRRSNRRNRRNRRN